MSEAVDTELQDIAYRAEITGQDSCFEDQTLTRRSVGAILSNSLEASAKESKAIGLTPFLRTLLLPLLSRWTTFISAHYIVKFSILFAMIR